MFEKDHTNNDMVLSSLAFLVTSAAVVIALKTTKTTTTSRKTTTPPPTTTTTTTTTMNKQMMMKELPKNVIKYSQVPKDPKKFTSTTIPKGLLKEHNTKKGTWGVIRVNQGQLRYQINEPIKSVHILSPNNMPGIIEPQIKHEVAPLSDDLEFVVEFYRIPNTGPVDEKREGL